MTAPVIVASGHSLAGSLQKLLGDDAVIIKPPLNLMYGPLVPFDIDVWCDWVERTIVYDLSTDELRHDWAVFLQTLDSAENLEIWLNKNFSRDYSAFLFALSKVQPQITISVVDATSHNLGRFPLAALPENKLAELRQTVSVLNDDVRSEYLILWQGLNANPSLLRLSENGQLNEVALDHFDETILAHVSRDEFSRSLSIVGKVLGYAQGDMADDLFIASRLVELIDAGLLEASGDLSDVGQLFVRRV